MKSNNSMVILSGSNTDVFQNENGEFCRVTRYYVKNSARFLVCFWIGSVESSVKCSRNALQTASEKKVINLLQNENFKKL